MKVKSGRQLRLSYGCHTIGVFLYLRFTYILHRNLETLGHLGQQNTLSVRMGRRVDIYCDV